MQPEFLEVTILWYPNDCETDKMEGNIITKTNPHWPKMHLAIHHADGINITKSEYNAIHAYVKMIIQNLMDLACSSLDPHLSNSKLPTKSQIKALLPTEFFQAILQLEAKHTVLCLCSSHWKAEAIISQVILGLRGTGKPVVDPSKPLLTHCACSSDPTILEHCTCEHSKMCSGVEPWSQVSLSITSPKVQQGQSHILQTEDDGPISTLKSPYVLHLIRSCCQLMCAHRDWTPCSMQVHSNVPQPHSGDRQGTYTKSSYFYWSLWCVHNTPSATHCSDLGLNTVKSLIGGQSIFCVYAPTDHTFAAVLTSESSFTSAPSLLQSMNVHPLFKQGKTSANILAFLDCVQCADPSLWHWWGQFHSKLETLSVHSRWPKCVVLNDLLAWNWQHCHCLQDSSCCPQDMSGCTGDVYKCWIVKYG